MREILLEERKKISLEILLQIDSICRKHSLKYFLAYGSLIGAIRHKGFIPWDDDIDIWMPYEDYKIFENKIKDLEGFYLLKAFGEKEWARPFAKLCKNDTLIVDVNGKSSIKRGIAVDIFPLFTCDAKKLNKLVYYCKMINRTFLYEHGYVSSRIKKVIFKHLSFFGRNSAYYCKKFLDFANKIGSGAYYFSPSPYLEKDIHETKLFDSKFVKFEGYEFPAPEGYHAILTHLYGDYMMLPPESQRVSNHNVKAYCIEEK